MCENSTGIGPVNGVSTKSSNSPAGPMNTRGWLSRTWTSPMFMTRPMVSPSAVLPQEWQGNPCMTGRGISNAYDLASLAPDA
jgi:hypothetical protein